jgi:tetratricopeptide (TPR) repeat protein
MRLQQEIQRGNLDSARSQLDVAIKEFPSEPGLYNLLGIVEAQKGNRDSAESDFKKALEYAPEFTGALLNLGRLYLEHASEHSKAPSQALDVYQKILRYDQTNAEALYQSAMLLVSYAMVTGALGPLILERFDEQVA